MKDNIFHCYACHYTFYHPNGTDSCPDCGMYDVQVATREQIAEYWEIQRELEAETQAKPA